MKTILIQALALLIAGLGCCKADEAPSLKAEIVNAKAIAGVESAISLDFVLTNLTDKPIILAERWNSWGAYQWSFTLVDKTGAKIELGNPQQSWRANFLSTFTIPAGGSHTLQCILLGSSGKSRNGPYNEFLPSPNHFERDIVPERLIPTKVTWDYPVKVTGSFSASVLHHLDRVSTNWTGLVSTPAVNVEEAEHVKAPNP